MHRRAVIKRVLGGALGVAAAVSASPSSAKPAAEPEAWDVIVVGGGFAGVTAARDASHRGLRTLLLEARDRLGGRTANADFGGRKIEVGGTWIGWAQPHVWAERMRYQAPIAESAAMQSNTQYVWVANGERHVGRADDYWAAMSPAYDAYYAPARAAFPQPYDPLLVKGVESLDRLNAAQAIEALKISPLQRELLCSLAAVCGHSPSDRSSYLDQLRWIALSGFSSNFMWDNLGRFRLERGTESLINSMISDSTARVELNQPVARISQTRDGVEVVTQGGLRHRAKAAVIALPLNVLSKVAFSPRLSSVKFDASVRRHTGSGVKVWAKTPRRAQPIFANGPEDFPLNFVWTEFQDTDSQLLVGFGASRERLDTADRTQVEAAIRRYVPDVEVQEIHSHDWTADPYALGTWCMYPPGMLTTALPGLQRPEGRLFFASADIATGWRGFIDGAIESGAIAARHVATELSGEGAQ